MVILVIDDSPKMKLNGADMKKVGKGFLIAMGGAGLTYIAQTLPTIDFGVWTPTVAALSAVFVNLAWKYLKG